jgi:hypothetical protein
VGRRLESLCISVHKATTPKSHAILLVLPFCLHSKTARPAVHLKCLPALHCLQDRSNNSGTLTAIQWLIIGSLILTGICDLAAAYIVLAANQPTFTIWRWRYVGGGCSYLAILPLSPLLSAWRGNLHA